MLALMLLPSHTSPPERHTGIAVAWKHREARVHGSRPGTSNPLGGPGLWAPPPPAKIKVAPPAISLSPSNINHMYTMTVANSGKEQFFYGVGVRTCSCLYSFRTS